MYRCWTAKDWGCSTVHLFMPLALHSLNSFPKLENPLLWEPVRGQDLSVYGHRIQTLPAGWPCSDQKFERQARAQATGVSLEFFPTELLGASRGGRLSNSPGSRDHGIQVKLFLRCDWVTPPELWGLPGGIIRLPMQETGLIPGSGRSPGEGNGNPLPRPLVFLDLAHFQVWFFIDPNSLPK